MNCENDSDATDAPDATTSINIIDRSDLRLQHEIRRCQPDQAAQRRRQVVRGVGCVAEVGVTDGSLARAHQALGPVLGQGGCRRLPLCVQSGSGLDLAWCAWHPARACVNTSMRLRGARSRNLHQLHSDTVPSQPGLSCDAAAALLRQAQQRKACYGPSVLGQHRQRSR